MGCPGPAREMAVICQDEAATTPRGCLSDRSPSTAQLGRAGDRPDQGVVGRHQPDGVAACWCPLPARCASCTGCARLTITGDVAENTAGSLRRPAGRLRTSTFTQIVAHLHVDCRGAPQAVLGQASARLPRRVLLDHQPARQHARHDQRLLLRGRDRFQKITRRSVYA